MPDLVGQTLLGRYHINELIGRGGMAEVYKAWDTRRQYHVAVKVMREDLAEDLEFLRRFKREARALAHLAHANVVRFYSFEREGRLAFIVMDYVEGTTLRGCILDAEGTPLPLDEVTSIVQQVCAALHYAHSENVLHRDVKSGNIMIQSDGRVLVADFGIAKAADAATATTVMPGTPAYMSPEQCRSEPLDARTDVYSLGVVVYEMLTGRRPFVGDQAPETVTSGTRERTRWEQMHAAPPPLRQFNPALSREVEAAVLKALAKERKERWFSALAFWQALGAALEGGVPGEEVDPVVEVALAPEPVVTQPAVAGRKAGAEEFTRPARPAPPAVKGPAATWLRRLPVWAWVVLGLALAGGAIIALIVAAGGIIALQASEGKATPPPMSSPAAGDTTVIGNYKGQAPLSARRIRLLFTSDQDGRQEVYRLTMEGNQRVTHTPGDGESWSPAILPDGTVLFTSDRDGKREVYRLNVEGTQRVTHTPGNGESWSPAVQPDGTVLFTSDRDGKREVYRLTGEGTQRVTHTPGNGESWSPAVQPDGTVLFTSDRDGKREAYRLNVKGTQRVTYTPGNGESWSPAVQPDGTVLFTSDRDGKREVYRLTGEGTQRVTYTPGDGESWSPAVLPDGTVLFTSDRDGKREVYRLTVEGTQRVTYTPGNGESWSPTW
jgi:Tol biopolymer transport system component/tRNA A-37 threonylcarbamoyl transferase component Bud32